MTWIRRFFCLFSSSSARHKQTESDFLRHIPCEQGRPLFENPDDDFFWNKSSLSYLQHHVRQYTLSTPLPDLYRQQILSHTDNIAAFIYLFRLIRQNGLHSSQLSLSSHFEHFCNASFSSQQRYVQLVIDQGLLRHPHLREIYSDIFLNEEQFILKIDQFIFLNRLFSELLKAPENRSLWAQSLPLNIAFPIIAIHHMDKTLHSLADLNQNQDFCLSHLLFIPFWSDLLFSENHPYQHIPMWRQKERNT